MPQIDELSPADAEQMFTRRSVNFYGWNEDTARFVRARMAPDGSVYARTVVEPFRGVEVTPASTGGGTEVAATDGVLYGAESPLGGPVVELRDANKLIAILVPGVARDFTTRPREFTGPLKALAIGLTAVTSILLDLE